MYVKIIEGLPRKAQADTENGVYKLTVKGHESGWGFWGLPSYYNYELIEDKCVLDLDNPTEEGAAALAAREV